FGSKAKASRSSFSKAKVQPSGSRAKASRSSSSKVKVQPSGSRAKASRSSSSKAKVQPSGSKAKASPKIFIVKSPIPIINVVLGLANAKTWDAILSKTFAVNIPATMTGAEEKKGKRKIEGGS
ncbi:hypothetical protein Tco_1396876, partial [Tanacetum coccineum]